MPVNDDSLKMLLFYLAWFIQRSEGATGRRKGIIISILQLRKQKKAEALQHVYLPEEVTMGFVTENPALASPAKSVLKTVGFYWSWITAE